MTGHHYYSPPPPSPPPPLCNYTKPPPPPPPPKCNPCPCVCICKLTEPPATPPYWPPPPHITPVGPGPIPPPRPPGPSNHTVIIAVCVSLGGAFFLAFLAVGLFCLVKRRRKKIIPPPVEADVCIEEHQHIQETITTSPCGDQTVTVTVDDDIRVHEVVAVGSYVEPLSDCDADGHLKTG